MSLTITLIVLIAAAIAFTLVTILARRPAVPGQVRLIPLGAIQFVSLLVVILMAAHLVSLLTGNPLTSRYFR
jgi:hypothetical protein